MSQQSEKPLQHFNVSLGAVTFLRCTDLVLAIPVDILHEDVHVDCEGDVLQHQEDVGHRDREQDQVDRVSPHFLVAQHDDVEEVEKCSQNTDDDGEVAVGSPVGVLSSQN